MKIIELFEDINKQKTAIMTFGRMNPPTLGHQKLYKKVKTLAKQLNADVYFAASKTQDNKKNPLTFEEKERFLKEIYDIDVFERPEIKTPYQLAGYLADSGYDQIVFVVGEDRIESFKGMLDFYDDPIKRSNGEIHQVDFELESAGERDPDSDGVEGMSASKLRAAALENDFNAFVRGFPEKADPTTVKEIFDIIRDRIKLKPKKKIKESIMDGWVGYWITDDGKIINVNPQKGYHHAEAALEHLPDVLSQYIDLDDIYDEESEYLDDEVEGEIIDITLRQGWIRIYERPKEFGVDYQILNPRSKNTLLKMFKRNKNKEQFFVNNNYFDVYMEALRSINKPINESENPLDGWKGSWITDEGDVIEVDPSSGYHHWKAAEEHFVDYVDVDDMYDDDGFITDYGIDAYCDIALEQGWTRVYERTTEFGAEFKTLPNRNKQILLRMIKNNRDKQLFFFNNNNFETYLDAVNHLRKLTESYIDEEMVWDTPDLGVMIYEETMFILYNATPEVANALKEYDSETIEDNILGVLDIRGLTTHYYVDRVYAQKGYGPLLYYMAMTKGYLAPHLHDVTPQAKAVWKKFSEMPGIKTKETDYNTTNHKEEYLNTAYKVPTALLRKANNIKQKGLRANEALFGQLTNSKIEREEMETLLLEAADSIISNRMRGIYG